MAFVLYIGVPSGTIQQYTTAGTPVSTLPLEPLNDIPESITILGGQLYVGDGSGRVNLIDPSTGAATALFATPNVGLIGLGTYNGTLLVVNDTPNSILQYSTGGLLLKSISLSSGPAIDSWSGLTSDNSTIYIGDRNSGNIYEYSLAGTPLGSFNSHLGSGLVVGSYDFTSGSIWVTNGSSVYDITTMGTILSSFAVSSGSFGVAVIPASSTTPEPASWGLLMAALVTSTLIRKRR